MGLGAPLALLLLAGLSLPWLVHRMRQRDLPVVKLPTIALLQRAMAVTQRRRALDDLLLMLTRMVLVAVIAFALAAPFVWGETLLLDGRPQSLVIVLDDSMSMQRMQDGSSLLERALDQARRTIRELPATSQVTVLAAGRPPRTLATLAAPTTALAALTSFTASPARGTELNAAIELAHATLAAAVHERRTILVISDFVGSADLAGKRDGPVELLHRRVGPADVQPNHCVEEATATRITDVPGSYRIRVRARSFHSTGRSLSVELQVNGAVLQATDLALQPDHGEVEFTLNVNDVKDADTVQVRLVTDDALTIDDQRHVLLRDPNALHVLLVNGDPHPTHSEDELHFLSRALPLRASDSVPLVIATTDAVGLERAPFDGVDLVWLANVEAPDADVATRLSSYVHAGGSLVISAGSHLDPAAYNARLSALLPGRIEGVQELPGIDISTDTPSANAWGVAATAIGHVTTTKRLVMSADEHTLLTYTDGIAALCHRDVGRGHVVVWTTSIDGDWTDLPYRPGFLALTAGILSSLTPPRDTSAVHEPGVAIRLAIADGSERAALIDPTGKRDALALNVSAVATTAAQTLLPGAYEVEVTDDNGVARKLLRAAFVVAPPIDESDLTPMNIAALDGDRRPNLATKTRVQRPFAYALFACLAPLFVLEALLRRQRRRASTTRSMPPRSV